MATSTKDKYTEAVGRRKTSVARVRIATGKESLTVNDRAFKDYFPTEELRNRIMSEILKIKDLGKHVVTVKVSGGGVSSQAEALRQGLARALVKLDRELKPAIKKAKLLSRDAREKERRKFGLKKARKSPQWSKR